MTKIDALYEAARKAKLAVFDALLDGPYRDADSVTASLVAAKAGSDWRATTHTPNVWRGADRALYGAVVTGPKGKAFTIASGIQHDDLAAFLAAANPQTVMVLVEVYRAALGVRSPLGSRKQRALAAAIEKVDSL